MITFVSIWMLWFLTVSLVVKPCFIHFHHILSIDKDPFVENLIRKVLLLLCCTFLYFTSLVCFYLLFFLFFNIKRIDLCYYLLLWLHKAQNISNPKLTNQMVLFKHLDTNSVYNNLCKWARSNMPLRAFCIGININSETLICEIITVFGYNLPGAGTHVLK